ncbi:MAG: 16S rRNA (guanine(966)-N(2))-methyltransferase RsmD [Gammaproteobacteria bacterium]|nr:16S rRNA (guanine(966)-N(2))-methyltransferase RsmD [Gammaproteobacteria bacterium]
MRHKTNHNGAGQRHTVRIIGGQWRSRKLSFPEQLQLRPTPDRVRVTLFNWLLPLLPGACCLDLFAGSGALGLEALSRGAARVVLVEQDRRVADNLRQQRLNLHASQAQVVNADALGYLSSTTDRFDIVFLDPPYHSELLLPACQLLEQRGWLHPEARIYLETGATQVIDQLPPNWQVIRHKRAGQVHYHLAVRLAN